MANDVFVALQPPYRRHDYVKLLVDADGKLITTASGTMNILAPTGPFEITVATVTTIAANPLTAPLTGRVALSIRNKGMTPVYFGKNASVTADDTATGGWEIGASEDFNIELDDSEVFYLIVSAGSALVKILEIAST